MMNIMKAYELLQEILPKTNELSLGEFLSVMCMLAEEYCLQANEDVVQIAEQIAELVRNVNEEEGRYCK